MSKWVRQIHRWLSIVFTLAVIATSIAIAMQGPMWASYLPLPPLFLMFASGLYLFFLPHIAKMRGKSPT